MSDQFTGRWLVTEYHYDPRGQFLGIVYQTRTLTPQPDGTLEVCQRCAPSADFGDHPMSRFKGDWVFTLRPEGAIRRYLGPDVVGSGISLGGDTIIGAGRWPRFGYDFISYGCLVTPERQITGGAFLNAHSLPISQIVGIGIPETREEAGQFPRLNQTVSPDPRQVWVGEWGLYSTRGEMQSPQTMRRCYKESVIVDELANGVRQESSLKHVFSYGCMRVVYKDLDGRACHQIEIYDALTQTLLGMRTWKDPDTAALLSYEIYRLHPEH
jgi:hypothetical protein